MASSISYIRAECPICVEHFKTPKLITCGHTFCLACIKQYIGDKTVHFRCPVCSQNVKIPKQGVEKFPTVFALQPSTSQSKVESSTDKYNLSSSQTKDKQPAVNVDPKCPYHSQRTVDIFCKTCHLGLCAKCMYYGHKDHESYDLDSEDTKTNALQELSNCEEFMKKKIEELEKYQEKLQESCDKLKDICEDSCNKITSKTENIIVELKEKSEKIKKDIRENLEENEKKLGDIISNNTKKIEKLKNVLKIEVLTLKGDATINILQSLPKLKEKEKQCDSKIVIPEISYLSIKESDCLLPTNILGVLQEQRLFIPDLQSVQKSNCFTFDSNIIQGYGRSCYSEDTVTDRDAVWRCCVRRNRDGNKLCIYIGLLEDDNPDIEYIDVKYKLSVVNSTDIQQSIIEEGGRKFIPGCGLFDYPRVITIEWSKLINPRAGFINTERQFHVKWEIIQLIKLKNKIK